MQYTYVSDDFLHGGNVIRSIIDADRFDNLDEVTAYAKRNVNCLLDLGIQINESVENIVEDLLMCPEDMLLGADGYLMTGYILSSISSPQLYIFDMEGSSYAEILEASANLSDGEICIENVIQENDDSAEYGVRIIFTCNGVDKIFIPRCDMGWIDVTVLSLINEDLTKKGSNKCLIFGQSAQMCYISFQTEEWMNRLNGLLPAKLCKL
ncbi:MAG: hypothetical protein K6G87_01240 [Butyrivibrio sp.]|uniref:hypothetical protein n=1 Tax=Butyrivibrio sp. TaxID=28121 RepID=UPI0025CE0046|nr:hypothetical protein [Butyrivibrio sp.]MCR5769837.1 hypothetical protein [Butyrivibrio sp.]